MIFSPKTPKIFLLASTLVMGGAERVLRSLALGLPEHGYSIHLCCLHELGPIGTELSRLGVAHNSGIAKGRYDAGVFARLVKIFSGDNRAIVFSLDHHNAVFWGALSSAAAGIKHRVLSAHSTGLWAKGGSFRFTDRLVIRLYDRIVALAKIHADYLADREGIDRGKIAIINNGVDVELFKPLRSDNERNDRRDKLGIPGDRFVVTIVAALRPEKNHGMLLSAAASIRRMDKDFVFLIVGDGSEAPRLRSAVGESRLQDSVLFMGARNDVPDILSVSDISVLCSFPVVETFPLSVLEAMASGVPVVTTAVGSISEMMRDGEEGIMIESDDADALVRALLELKNSPSKRKEMGEKARGRVVAEFSEGRMVAGYARLFRDLLEGGTGV